MSASLDYVIEDSVDYELYNNSSWNDIDGFLEQNIQNEKQRLEQQLEQIYRQLDERESIHSKRLQSVKNEIRRQKNRLESAERAPGNNDTQIRNRLEKLYREKREAQQSLWNDKQELLAEKRSLEKEIQEISESKELNKLL